MNVTLMLSQWTSPDSRQSSCLRVSLWNFLFFARNQMEASMKNVMLVGGGKIGIAITELLSNTGDYHVTVVDRDAASLERMPHKNVTREAARSRRCEAPSRTTSKARTSSSPPRPIR